MTIDVLSGSGNPDGDVLTVAAAGPAANGSVIVNPDGTVTYTPVPGFKGVDSFEVTISEGRGGSVTITVTVTVENAPPVAVDDAVATLPATLVTIPVLANDSDANGDLLTVTAVTPATNGTATLAADGSVTHTPNPGFKDVDTFTYTITDGTDTASATTCDPVSACRPTTNVQPPDRRSERESTVAGRGAGHRG